MRSVEQRKDIVERKGSIYMAYKNRHTLYQGDTVTNILTNIQLNPNPYPDLSYCIERNPSQFP